MTPRTLENDTVLLAGGELERRLEELEGLERFPPPAAFVGRGTAPAPDTYADPDAFWAEQARALDWIKPFTHVLDDSHAPFYRWFSDGILSAAHNCNRPPCRERARRARRVPLGRR